MYSSRYSCPILIKLEFYWLFFEKYGDVKIHKNPSSGILIVSWWRTDIMKLIVDFRNFANAPKNLALTVPCLVLIWLNNKNDFF